MVREITKMFCFMLTQPCNKTLIFAGSNNSRFWVQTVALLSHFFYFLQSAMSAKILIVDTYENNKA